MLSLLSEPATPIDAVRQYLARGWIKRNAAKSLERLRMIDAGKESIGRLQQAGMLRIAVLEHIEKEGAVVDAGAEQSNISGGV